VGEIIPEWWAISSGISNDVANVFGFKLDAEMTASFVANAARGSTTENQISGNPEHVIRLNAPPIIGMKQIELRPPHTTILKNSIFANGSHHARHEAV
jgi:hypothetical protein